MSDSKSNNFYLLKTYKSLEEIEYGYLTHPSCSVQSSIIDHATIATRKKNIFEHLFYEIEMLIYCKREIEQLKNPNKDSQYLLNVLYTSSMTYLRNLIYFFYKKDYEDDIVYTMILKDYSSIPMVEDNLKRECEKEISKNVHHITIKRIKENEHDKMASFFNDAYIIIIDKCKNFLDKLSFNNVNDKYISQLKDYEQEKNDLLNKLNNSIVKGNLHNSGIN